MEPRGREQVIAAGDPRPPELRRPSPRSWAQRQLPSPGLIEASYRLRTRFSGIPLLARVSEAPGSREASGAAAARGKQSCGRAGTTGPRAVTTSRARALGAVFALQPRGLRLQTAPEAETSGAGGLGPACDPAHPTRASRTACDGSSAGRRGRARVPRTRQRAGCCARRARAPAEQPPSPGPRRGRRTPALAREDSLQTP